MKHISCLLPAIALVLAACGRAPEPQQTSAPKGVTQSSLVAQGESATPAIVGPCPFQWTCDHQRWYSTQSA
ncbi:MAG: hypothetical protein ABIY55_34945, partial [Kofleriaceae bacterium]